MANIRIINEWDHFRDLIKLKGVYKMLSDTERRELQRLSGQTLTRLASKSRNVKTPEERQGLRTAEILSSLVTDVPNNTIARRILALIQSIEQEL